MYVYACLVWGVQLTNVIQQFEIGKGMHVRFRSIKQVNQHYPLNYKTACADGDLAGVLSKINNVLIIDDRSFEFEMYIAYF